MNEHIFYASVQLSLLSGALDFAGKCVAKELAAIDESLEDGSAPEDFDWEAAQNAPTTLMWLTSRAVAYEAVALVEHRLQELAREPWAEKPRKAPKSGKLSAKQNAHPETWASRKEVSEEHFDEICSLVEQHYNVKLKDMDASAKFFELRATVNSLKHGKLSRRVKKQFESKPGEFLKYLLDPDVMSEEEARKAIADVSRFLGALEHAVAHHPPTP